MIKTVLFIH